MKGLKPGDGCALLFGLWLAAAARAGTAAADNPAAVATTSPIRPDIFGLPAHLMSWPSRD